MEQPNRLVNAREAGAAQWSSPWPAWSEKRDARTDRSHRGSRGPRHVNASFKGNGSWSLLSKDMGKLDTYKI